MKVRISEVSLPTSGGFAVGVFEGRKLTPSAERIDKKTGGALRRAVRAGRFKGAHGEVVRLIAPAGTKASPILAIGLGKAKDLTDLKWQAIGGTLVKEFNATGAATGHVAIDAVKGSKLNAQAAAAHVAFGAQLGAYRFDRYRTKEKPEHKPTLKSLRVMCASPAKARSSARVASQALGPRSSPSSSSARQPETLS